MSVKCNHYWESICVDPGYPNCLVCEVERLKAKLKRILNIKYDTHKSWNCDKDFNAGWKACREQIDDSIADTQEQSDE